MMIRGLRASDDRGSMPVALMVIMMLTAATTIMLTTTVVGKKTTKFDESFTSVVQAADAGVQDAVLRLNNGSLTADGSSSGTVAAGSYEWTATFAEDEGWTVRSVGTLDGVDREVIATVAEEPRYRLGAFADRFLNFNGGNIADSYSSITGDWYTLNGSIGSNGDLTVLGHSTRVDQAYLFGTDGQTDEEIAERCEGVGNDICDDPVLADKPITLSGENEMAFIYDQLAVCEAAGDLETWRASENGGVLSSADGTCFKSIVFDVDTQVIGSVELYVSEGVSISNHTEVNCEPVSCTEGSATPDATALQIFVGGQDATGVVAIGNQSKFAGTIYAPRAACGGNPSNAQAEIFGAMVCKTIENVGGWEFHYDDALSEIGTGRYYVGRYDEA